MSLRGMPEPLLDLLRGPACRAAGVAAVAGVGHPQLHRQIRPGNAEAVIATRVHAHVGGRRHVALDAPRSRRVRTMKVVLRARVGLRRMASQTDAVPVSGDLRPVGVVAVAATHPFGEHPALEERAVLIHLTFDLTVGKVEVVVQQRHAVVIAQRLAVDGVLVDEAPPRMATRAGLELTVGLAGHAPVRLVGDSVAGPGHALAFVERDQQPLGAVHASPVPLLARP